MICKFKEYEKRFNSGELQKLEFNNLLKVRNWLEDQFFLNEENMTAGEANYAWSVIEKVNSLV